MIRHPYALIGMTLAIAGAMLQVGCSKTYNDIGEKPAPNVVPGPPATKEQSLISLNALFPYGTISNAIGSAIPASIPVEGRKGVCQDVKVGSVKISEICTDVDYKATVVRGGDVSITPNGDSVRLTMPLSVDGYAGFNGFVADLLKLNKKNFRGAMNVHADVKFDVDEAWCPKVTVTPSYEWTSKAEFEIAGRWWIPVDSQVDESLKPMMAEAAAKIPGLVTCDQVKQLVGPAWHEYVIALPPISGQAGSIVVEPQRVGFSGLSYLPSGVQLAMMIGANADVRLSTPGAAASAVPLKAAAQVAPLPKLERIPAQQNTLKLSVPLLAEFAAIQKLASEALVDKPFEGEAAGAQGTVTVKEVVVYPSGERLVVGVKFESKISKPKSLAPQGWVYLMAKPGFDAATQTLRLDDVGFSRAIDNDLWNAVSFIFQDKIRSEIEKAARYDLRPKIAEVQALLKSELATPKSGIKIDLKDAVIGLDRVALVETGVLAVARFEGAANITVLSLPTQ